MSKKHYQYKNSYKVWNPTEIIDLVMIDVGYRPKFLYKLNILLEWWAHNIGYWVTLPFIKNEDAKRINIRCKNVDLMIKQGGQTDDSKRP